ncbi:hypothetical protein GTY83_19170 [Streptomyces sp. SID4928]|uniref:hypothetical protein n=1 Tax=unclassified Streptomyces TaxID=2593676 RepID=UPI0001C1A56F|nr:hypothetical protein [Streptomyces sp. ACT-1]EGE43194.1 hypothetical protein SACT1_3863 [Streptomyces sp. ACT-1]MYR51232.1 hypothetical protein [Streptomyces sp. SID4928]
MKLSPKDLKWHMEVTGLARRLGWTVLEGQAERQRLEDPSFVAVRGREVIAVWLRSSAPRAQRVPLTNRFPGVPGFVWSPPDMVSARVVLTVGAEPDEGGGPDAA